MAVRSILFGLLSVLIACGAGDDPGTGDGSGGGGGGGGSDADAGAGGGGGGGDCAEPPCLAPPDRGFQVRSVGQMIQPGEDVEYCEVVQLPGDPSETYYVNKFESEMTAGSHHLIVVAAEPGSETEQGMTNGDTVNCNGPGGFGEDVLDVTGSQTIYDVDEFPEGVGRIYHGGQFLVFDYHYLNTTDAPIRARAAVNFHTVDEADVQKVARDFGFYNLQINIPPGEERGFSKACTFSEDVVVHKLVRHTHQWGTDFNVYWEGGPNDGERIFTTPNYEDNDYVFPEPVEIPAGQGFRFECNYHNTTDYTLTFGVKATDEMCILFGVYWFPGAEGSDQGCYF